MIELENHPYFLGCQFHPEFKSRPTAPHPLFSGFVQAAVDFRNRITAPQADLTETVGTKLGPSFRAEA
jgi:CTP synthase